MYRKLAYGTVVAVALAVLVPSAVAGAAEDAESSNWLELSPEVDASLHQEGAGWQKPVPVNAYWDYTLVTDYIWRGINYSEYPGEGTEALNHQFGAGASVDTNDLIGRDFGRVGVSLWWQFYADQNRVQSGIVGEGDTCNNLQEVDYSLYWQYDLPEMYTTVELGWIYYAYPTLGGDAHSTNEAYASLEFDDSWVWNALGIQADQGVLNPTLYYGFDLDNGDGGQWIELGVSHAFDLAEMGMGDMPVARNLTVTPSATLGVDHRYLHNFSVDPSNDGEAHTQLAFLNYGLSLDYDLSSALGISPQYGNFAVSGFLNFSQALENELVDDELYGGMTVAWNW